MGTKYSIIGSIVNAYGNKWYKIADGTWSGYWINDRYLELYHTALNTNDTGTYEVIDGDWTDFYSEPYSGTSIGCTGKTLAVAGSVLNSYGNKWYQLVGGNWVFSGKVRLSASSDYTITYNANGGTGTMAAQTVTAGTAAALKTNTFTRNGYSFTGWNTKADGTGKAYADRANVTLTANLILYAVWKKDSSSAPSKPTELSGVWDYNTSTGKYDITIKWKAVNEAVRYRVYYKTSSGIWDELEESDGTKGTISTNSVIAHGFSASRESVDIRVIAVNSSGSESSPAEKTLYKKAVFNKIVALDVAAYFQIDPNYCSAASAKTVLNYFGKAENVTEAELQNTTAKKSSGIVKALNTYLSDAYTMKDFGLNNSTAVYSAIESSLDSGYPVIGYIGFPSSKFSKDFFNYSSDGHFTTIVGIYSDDNGAKWLELRDSHVNRNPSQTYCNKDTGAVFVPFSVFMQYLEYYTRTPSVELVYHNIAVSKPTAPTISTNRTVYTAGDTVLLSFSQVEGALKYEYYVAEFPEAFAYTTSARHDFTTETSVRLTDLPASHYSVFAHAVNNAGNSPQSNWVSFDIYEKNYVPVITKSLGGHIYYVYDNEASWTFCKSLCEDMGGHLVTINSAEECEFIDELIQSGAKDAYWIGATNYDASAENQDGTWKWVTGEPFSYTNWKAGEPYASGTKGMRQHWAELRKSFSYVWNNTYNTNTANKGFILEIDSHITITSDKESANTGETITWTATGGSGSIQFFFYVLKDGNEDAVAQSTSYSEANTFSYTPTEPGIYTVKVFVRHNFGIDNYKLITYRTNRTVPVTSAGLDEVSLFIMSEGTTLHYEIQNYETDKMLLLIADYDSFGRMIRVQHIYQLQETGDIKVDENVRHRVFLLDNNSYAPLCTGWDSTG